MHTFRLLSALLEYPDDSLLQGLRETVETAGQGGVDTLLKGVDWDECFTEDQRQTIARFTMEMLAIEPREAQARYVQTFDLTAEHSLHLTHHIFGEEKTRGPALIDLTEYLKSYGYAVPEGELPDYLPLLLEFVSELSVDEGRVFLGDMAKVLKVLAANLEKANSPYAPLIRIIESHGSLVKLAA